MWYFMFAGDMSRHDISRVNMSSKNSNDGVERSSNATAWPKTERLRFPTKPTFGQERRPELTNKTGTEV